MDLDVGDVAALLSLSETTIRRWLKDGKIPAYRLNHQYRFDRAEIEDWMMRCKLKMGKDGFSFLEEKEGPEARGGTQQFSLYRAMFKGGVIAGLPMMNKEELIRTVMQKAASRMGLDPDVMTELLLDREELMSTALNSGLAVPHPRDLVLKIAGSDTIVTVFPEKPIEYGALDGQPVHTLFFLFSASDKTHLHLLSKLAHLGGQAQALDFFVTKPNTDALLGFVRNWEENLI